MDFVSSTQTAVISRLGTDKDKGLSSEKVVKNRVAFGSNTITEKKRKTIVNRVIEALIEPMMLILLVALSITFGVNIARSVSGKDTDFYECVGILIAIGVSTALTVIMEGKSEKAFRLLKSLDDGAPVKVLRDGKITFVSKTELVVGDIVFVESGNKIHADGRIIASGDLKIDESTLTGESEQVKKSATATVKVGAPLAEWTNYVFSGTFVCSGTCKYVVTAVGDNAEMGKIAGEVTAEKSISAPLEEKLSRLGKMVTVWGGVASAVVFILSLIRLILLGEVTFDGVQSIFVDSIVLIVAAVPEGLPTTVAISLTLNVVRLAKSNALIKKLVATETVGCVSVICSDKTGTLTQNKMTVEKIVTTATEYDSAHISSKNIILNCAINSTAESEVKKGVVSDVGSMTECALLRALSCSGKDYRKIRKSGAITRLTPFSSDKKYMQTTAVVDGINYDFIKGAPEIVIEKCLLSKGEREDILKEVSKYQRQGARVLAFASSNGGSFSYDGFAVISDALRSDVKDAVQSCKNAGIKVKMLTGDNIETARYIAENAGFSVSDGEVVTADEIEKTTDEELIRRLPQIAVIARSTPSTKLRVVTLLQKSGEVVAVTGDGVNDAPAIRHADIGIAMGDGSEITKQASDIVLLDNSFSTILTAISFGRNVYANFQRFITFQLTVNLASMTIIIAYLLMGFVSPFSSTCLLWLNIIMDGPLALSLGLEMRPVKYLSRKPVKRSDDILNFKILVRIGLHAAIACVAVCMQQLFNYIGCSVAEEKTVVITMFVFFQVFNAINCREVTSASSFKGILNNKLLLIMLAVTYFLHIAIVTFLPGFFGTVRLPIEIWLKITAVCSSIVFVSEGYKFVYRRFAGKNFLVFGKKSIVK